MAKYYRERWDGLPVVRYTLLQASSESTVCPGVPIPTPEPTPQPTVGGFVGLGEPYSGGAGMLVPEDCVDNDSFVAVVRAYYGSIDDMTKYGEDTIDVVRRDGRWVLLGWDEDGFNRGDLRGDPVRAARVYLPAASDAGCRPEGAERLVAVERIIPDTDHFALNAVEEVISGPWKLGDEGADEQDVQGAFSPFSRVWSVKVKDGSATVSVTATTLSADWPCSVEVRRAAIERTVRDATGVSEVKISTTPERGG